MPDISDHEMRYSKPYGPPWTRLKFALLITDEGMEWMDDAACRGMDYKIFFPDRGGSTRIPKTICRECPVRLDCLEWAIQTGQKHGIWGGMSERERRKMKVERARREGMVV